MYFSTMYDCQTSSSSSSSLSGVTTPVDGVLPRLVPFPNPPFSKNGLTSSGSSSSSLDKHRPRHLSFSSSGLPTNPRPVKLSLESSKATLIPALPSASEDHSPLGAFSLTSSAEGHLRSLVTRAVSPRLSTEVTGSSPRSTTASPVKRERASSLRVLPLAWASNTDIEEEEEGETFWPRQNLVARRVIPSISRSPSPPKVREASSPALPDPRTDFASARSVCMPKPYTQKSEATARKPSHLRANSYAAPSAQPRTIATLRSLEAPHTPRAFLRPMAKNKGKAVTRLPPGAGNALQLKESPALDPALAAVESASRLRAKCVCRVCGKLGVDFPRCPRCSATWCSRECRVSNVAAGSARHMCNGKGSGQSFANARPISIGA